MDSCRLGQLGFPGSQVLHASSFEFFGLGLRPRQCLALPDVAKRQQRAYSTDASWFQGLTLEDVEILRRRAADLDGEGYMSMTPYFESCDFSDLPGESGRTKSVQDVT